MRVIEYWREKIGERWYVGYEGQYPRRTKESCESKILARLWAEMDAGRKGCMARITTEGGA